jgi:endonuclease YncB( thermonuclease family)
VIVVLGCTSVDAEQPPPATVPAALARAGSDAGSPSAADTSAGVPSGPTAGPSRESGGLRQAAAGGDGDSWRDTAGQEYRLGLVNTPETDECFGSQATAERKALTAAGFAADVYTTDSYGRSVAVVRLADGRNLNVQLARYGFANDRYLAQFRSENPPLAGQLDAAFAAARSERRGLWAACSGGDRPATPASAAPVPLASTAPATSDADCHPDYATCVRVQGDGSGRGQANDLDCGSLPGPVRLRKAGVDPYRLDGDRDGVGCDS